MHAAWSQLRTSGCFISRAVILAAVLAVMACGKRNDVQTVAPPAPSASTLTQTNFQVDLPELQRTVLRWVLTHRPASFEEIAATPGLQIPPAPTGKKFTLTKDLHVLLVDR
jgi:hypothetical protein